MKNIFGIMTALLLSTQAFASTYEAKLDHLDIDPKLQAEIGGPAFNDGSVAVNMNKKEVTLTLWRIQSCSGICNRLALAPYIVTLPIVNISKDGCKIPHITAQSDKRNADGSFEVIVVRDNTKSKCMYALGNNPTFRMPAPTEAEYNTASARGVKTDSHFEGAALEKVSN